MAASPRLILTEWNLPSMPAGKLAQWIAQRRPNAEVPVIVFANLAEGEELLPNVAGVLRKPFSLRDMLAEVRRVLRRLDSVSRAEKNTPIALALSSELR